STSSWVIGWPSGLVAAAPPPLGVEGPPRPRWPATPARSLLGGSQRKARSILPQLTPRLGSALTRHSGQPARTLGLASPFLRAFPRLELDASRRLDLAEKNSSTSSGSCVGGTPMAFDAGNAPSPQRDGGRSPWIRPRWTTQRSDPALRPSTPTEPPRESHQAPGTFPTTRGRNREFQRS